MTITVQEFAETNRDQIDSSLDIEHAEWHEAGTNCMHADTDNTRAFLGYKPSVPIETGISRIIN